MIYVVLIVGMGIVLMLIGIIGGLANIGKALLVGVEELKSIRIERAIEQAALAKEFQEKTQIIEQLATRLDIAMEQTAMSTARMLDCISKLEKEVRVKQQMKDSGSQTKH